MIQGSRFSTDNFQQIASRFVSATWEGISSVFSLVEGAVDTVTFDPSKRRAQFLSLINTAMSSLRTFFSKVSATGSSRGSWLKSRAVSILTPPSKAVLGQLKQVRTSYLTPLSARVAEAFSSVWKQSARPAVQVGKKASLLTYQAQDQISSFARATAQKMSSWTTPVLEKASEGWTFTKSHLSQTKEQIQKVDRKHIAIAAGAVSAVGLVFVAVKSISSSMAEIHKHYHNLFKEHSFHSSLWSVASLMTALAVPLIAYTIQSAKVNSQVTALSDKINQDVSRIQTNTEKSLNGFLSGLNTEVKQQELAQASCNQEEKEFELTLARLQAATTQSYLESTLTRLDKEDLDFNNRFGHLLLPLSSSSSENNGLDRKEN